MAKTSTTLTVVALAAIVLIGIMSYAVFFKAPQTALDGQTNAGGSGIGYISTGATSLTLVTTDKLSPGTATGASSQVSVDGAAFASDDKTISASPNQVLDILVINDTTYHNAYIEDVKVPTSPTGVINAPLYANGSMTINVFNTNGVIVSSAVTNQTATAGGSYNMKVRMDGSDKKTTNPMRCVLEASNKTSAESITLSGFGATLVGASAPASYSAAANSLIAVYDIDAVTGATSPEGTLAIKSKSGETLAAGVGTTLTITCYSKEYFLDSSTGKVAFGIEDSLGTAQYMNSYSEVVWFYTA